MRACLICWIGILLIITGCQPEMPVTSTITIDGEARRIAVNQELYGLTIEEINHAIEGGIYAELIQNRSFEEGVPPLNCPFDPVRRVLRTPNGWTIPFLRADSVPGWRRFSATSYLYPDTKELINDKNRRSLLVSVSASAETGKGGVIAEGYKGISLRKGARYDLSFYIKTLSAYPKTVSFALADSSGETLLSEVFQVTPSYEWKKYGHTFTATDSTAKAVLTITTDSSALFWLDVVSLFPQQTWKGRANGMRPELMTHIEALHPRFIRFPGGSFAEGYTAGTYPIWHETIGDIASRKHFWNVWAYGSTNGVGFHEFLQLCEDLGAEPIYVVNSGITSQSRRPRYEDITKMDKLVQDALGAIAYANEPADSLIGSLRAKQGHPDPFHLKYIEIGSENYGQEYAKRFKLFKEAIREIYPDVTVISSSRLRDMPRREWADAHFHSTEPYLIANHNRFIPTSLSQRIPSAFIGEFGLTDGAVAGTMQAAISEACFLTGVENGQEVVRGLAYAPVVGNTQYPLVRQPLIAFDGDKTVLSPSYYLWQMYSNNRGDEVLKTEVQTYNKPQVLPGYAGIYMFDNSYEFTDVQIDNRPVTDGQVVSGNWEIKQGTLTPVPNRWNYLLLGDSASYNYTFSANIRRTKGSGQIQLRVRDNGLPGEQSDYIGLTIGAGTCELFRQAGGVRDTLRTPVDFPFQSKAWYRVKISCQDERIHCYVNDTLVHEAALRPLPSLVATTAFDKEREEIILKVVNTTHHEERTALNLQGLNVANSAEIIQLCASPEAHNTYDTPDAIVPETKVFTFPIGVDKVYIFPPNSITVMRLKGE